MLCLRVVVVEAGLPGALIVPEEMQSAVLPERYRRCAAPTV
jgi:hypothetical protein